MSQKGWIGVDLDGTLAHYDDWKGPEYIGEPIPAMVERVKRWLAEGKTVKIFTARVWKPRRPSMTISGTAAFKEYTKRAKEAVIARRAIQVWCRKHLGRVLEITNEKDFDMINLYDDRCIQVELNTGKLAGK